MAQELGNRGESTTIISSTDIKLKVGNVTSYLTKDGKLIQSDKPNFKETGNIESESKDGIYIQNDICYIKLKGNTHQINTGSAGLNVQFVNSVSDVATSSSDSLIIDRSTNSLYFLINGTLRKFETNTAVKNSDDDKTESTYKLPDILNDIVDSCNLIRRTLHTPYYLETLSLNSSEIFSTTSNTVTNSLNEINFGIKPFINDDSTSVPAIQSFYDNSDESQLDTTPLLLNNDKTESELNLTDICHLTPYYYVNNGYVYIYYKVKDETGNDEAVKIVPVLTPTLSAIQSQASNDNALKYLYTFRNSLICNSKIKTETGDLDEIITKFDERIATLENTATNMDKSLSDITTIVKDIQTSVKAISDWKSIIDDIKETVISVSDDVKLVKTEIKAIKDSLASSGS